MIIETLFSGLAAVLNVIKTFRDRKHFKLRFDTGYQPCETQDGREYECYALKLTINGLGSEPASLDKVVVELRRSDEETIKPMVFSLENAKVERGLPVSRLLCFHTKPALIDTVTVFDSEGKERGANWFEKRQAKQCIAEWPSSAIVKD